MHRRMITAALITCAFAVSTAGLAGCAPATSTPSGGAMSDSTPSTRPPFQTATPGPVSGAPTGTPVDVPQSRWDAIARDLAARGVAGTPELISAEAVTFSDSSLGCATPGQSYTQALVDGMRVVAFADGKSWDYRFGTGDAPVLCTR